MLYNALPLNNIYCCASPFSCAKVRISNSEAVSFSEEQEHEQQFGEESIATESTTVDNNQRERHPQVSSPIEVENRISGISSSPSASSDSGHCSRASPDITSLSETPNGPLRSMASASGESPTDYHHSWGMCGNDVKVDSTSISGTLTSHALNESDSSIYSTSVDHLTSPYTELSPTHQTTYGSSYFESMQAAYQSPYSAGSAAAAAAAAASAFAGYYPQTNAYGVIPPSYGGSRAISSQCKSSSSAALAAQAAYLNPSFSSNFSNNTSQTPQNSYCYGNPYTSSFSNTSANSQNCQQSGFDYSTYGGFGHSGGYTTYYTNNYPNAYLPNATTNVNSSSASSHSLSSSGNSSSVTTYQLTQLPQQNDPNIHFHHNDASPSPIKAEPLTTTSSSTKKGTTKSGRGRGRRQPNPSPDPENNLERVFIWDLDETIIIYLSLLNGTRATKFVEDNTEPTIYDMGMQLEDLLNRFAENHFFYNDLEDVDQPHVDDASSDDNGQDISTYNFQTDNFHTTTCTQQPIGHGLTSSVPVRGGVDWLRKMAFRYRRIKEIYTQYRNNVEGLLNAQDRDNLYKIQRKWDALTDSWTLLALKCLQIIHSRPNCVNVLVTSIPLVPSLAKVMIFGVAGVFAIENIYSAAKIGKENIFERIINRFGRKCTYVVIGDGKDEEMAAKQHNLPFWRVTGHSDLIAFHHALDLEHL